MKRCFIFILIAVLLTFTACGEAGMNSEAESAPEISESDPLDYGGDKDAKALADEIFDDLEDDYRIAAAILTNQVSKPVNYSDGVDKNGNLREIDGDWYIPLVEEYDTVDEIMVVFRKVYTEQKCDKLYSELFGEDGYMKEIDGTLYCGDWDVSYYPFNVPIESAERISDIEILAKTSVTYDSGDVPYEISFKYEHGDWRIDKLSEDGREVNY